MVAVGYFVFLFDKSMHMVEGKEIGIFLLFSPLSQTLYPWTFIHKEKRQNSKEQMCVDTDSPGIALLLLFSTCVLLSIFKDTLRTERLTRNTNMNRYPQICHSLSKRLGDERSPSR